MKKDHIITKGAKDNTMLERKILMDVKYTFLINLYYSFQTPERLYFVMDYANGGDLYFHLKKKGPMGEKAARFYGSELLLALDHLHKQRIIYRDLKPENILLCYAGHIRLTDFGLST
jgi:protein-serine/threonine kinase